jgi:hypothetical protein
MALWGERGPLRIIIIIIIMASTADPSLYYFHGEEHGRHYNIYVLVYVDDLLIASKSLTAVQEVKQHLKGPFDARDLGEAQIPGHQDLERPWEPDIETVTGVDDHRTGFKVWT